MAGRNPKFASCPGGWGERLCPRSVMPNHSVAVDRTPNLPVGRRTTYEHPTFHLGGGHFTNKLLPPPIGGVTERRCLSKGILSQQKIRRWALTEYIFRLRSRHHQLLFKFNLLRKDCKKLQIHAWELHAAFREQCLRTIVQQVTPRLPATMSQP